MARAGTIQLVVSVIDEGNTNVLQHSENLERW